MEIKDRLFAGVLFHKKTLLSRRQISRNPTYQQGAKKTRTGYCQASRLLSDLERAAPASILRSPGLFNRRHFFNQQNLLDIE